MLFYKDNSKSELSYTQLNNLLVIPKNTEHNGFLEVETQLIRLKREDEHHHRKKRRLGLSTFEEVLFHFIEDLYIHKYFRDSGNTQAIKSCLEHIPLIQCIIYKFLFDYFGNVCLNIRPRDWKLSNKIEHFEDAYLNYSKFLAQPQNERLFQKGGWFVKDISAQKNHDIDAELYQIEEVFLSIKRRFKVE